MVTAPVRGAPWVLNGGRTAAPETGDPVVTLSQQMRGDVGNDRLTRRGSTTLDEHQSGC